MPPDHQLWLAILAIAQTLIATLILWVLRSVVELHKEVAVINTKLNTLPLAQIQDNTTRINHLEQRVVRVESGCDICHVRNQ
jgi:hypothetical protein